MSATTNRSVVLARHAEVGRQRGERVVGDLGLGGGETGQQRRLAGVRQPHQTRRRPPCGAPPAAVGPPRPRPARRCGARGSAVREGRVAPAATAAARHHGARALPHQVGDRARVRPAPRCRRAPGSRGPCPRLRRAWRSRPGCPPRACWCGWSASHDRSWTPRDRPRTRRSHPRPPLPPSGPPLRLVGLAVQRARNRSRRARRVT